MADLTLAEAARRLRLSPSTLRAQVRSGRLRATLVGKTYVVSEAEVERYRLQSRGRVGRPRHAAGAAAPLGLIDSARLGWIAGRYGISSLAIFGSAARGEAGSASDVDIVMELESDSPVGLFEHAEIAEDLAQVFRRPVDLVTWQALRPRIRAEVERDAVVIFSR